MKLTFKGVYRYRTRVKILWFWITKPWQEMPLNWSETIDSDGMYGRSLAPGIDAFAFVTLQRGDVFVGISAFGFKVEQRVIGGPLNVPVDWQPVKGCIIRGAFTLS